jgi:hypothetical protein
MSDICSESNCWSGQDMYYIDLDIVYSQMLLFVLLSEHLNCVVFAQMGFDSASHMSDFAFDTMFL